MCFPDRANATPKQNVLQYVRLVAEVIEDKSRQPDTLSANTTIAPLALAAFKSQGELQCLFCVSQVGIVPTRPGERCSRRTGREYFVGASVLFA